MLTDSIELTGQHIMYVLNICSLYLLAAMTLLSLHPSSFNENPPTFLQFAIGECLNTVPMSLLFRLHFHTWQHLDYSTMALNMNDEHIICYHMDTYVSGFGTDLFFLTLTFWFSNAGPMLHFHFQIH